MIRSYTDTVYLDWALLYWHSEIRLRTLILTQCIQTEHSYTDTVLIRLGALKLWQWIRLGRSYTDTAVFRRSAHTDTAYSDSALNTDRSIQTQSYTDSSDSALLYWHSVIQTECTNTYTDTVLLYSDWVLLYWHSVFRLSALILTQCIQTQCSYTDTVYSDSALLYWHSVFRLSALVYWHSVLILTQIRLSRSYTDTVYSDSAALILTQCIQTQCSYTDTV